jgi:hypothetical protein
MRNTQAFRDLPDLWLILANLDDFGSQIVMDGIGQRHGIPCGGVSQWCRVHGLTASA